MLVSVAGEMHRGRLVDIVVAPLCDRMYALRDADAAFLSLCGKGFTHLARLCPAEFRAQVALLSEPHRAVLQQVMVQALQSQQQQQQQQLSSTSGNAAQQSSSSSAGPPLLKLDMNKYKK